MELIEIKGLFNMDKGAPSPTVISNDNKLFLTFYEDLENIDELHKRNTVYDCGVIVITFNKYLKYTFGMPGNETIQGHPYSNLGMQSYSFYELRNSDLIEALQNIDKMHPFYNTNKWDQYKHYILTFHDNMFECVAQNFIIKEQRTSIYNQVSIILKEISATEF